MAKKSMAAPINFRAVVDRAAEIVEREGKGEIHIQPDAREALVKRVVEHDADVRRAIKEQGLKEEDLVKAAVNQLQEGVEEARPPLPLYLRLTLIVRRLSLVEGP